MKKARGQHAIVAIDHIGLLCPKGKQETNVLQHHDHDHHAYQDHNYHYQPDQNNISHLPLQFPSISRLSN